jgi:hypothetical protein
MHGEDEVAAGPWQGTTAAGEDGAEHTASQPRLEPFDPITALGTTPLVPPERLAEPEAILERALEQRCREQLAAWWQHDEVDQGTRP